VLEDRAPAIAGAARALHGTAAYGQVEIPYGIMTVPMPGPADDITLAGTHWPQIADGAASGYARVMSANEVASDGGSPVSPTVGKPGDALDSPTAPPLPPPSPLSVHGDVDDSVLSTPAPRIVEDGEAVAYTRVMSSDTLSLSGSPLGVAALPDDGAATPSRTPAASGGALAAEAKATPTGERVAISPDGVAFAVSEADDAGGSC
jgi:hypothetical protein